LRVRQRDLYETVRASNADAKVRVTKSPAADLCPQPACVILDALLKLRQVCCDPRLVALAASASKVK
jgi:hypothetical protein